MLLHVHVFPLFLTDRFLYIWNAIIKYKFFTVDKPPRLIISSKKIGGVAPKIVVESSHLSLCFLRTPTISKPISFSCLGLRP